MYHRVTGQENTALYEMKKMSYAIRLFLFVILFVDKDFDQNVRLYSFAFPYHRAQSHYLCIIKNGHNKSMQEVIHILTEISSKKHMLLQKKEKVKQMRYVNRNTKGDKFSVWLILP